MTHINEMFLLNRDYTVIIAKTAVDGTVKPPGFAERWTAAQEAIVSLAQRCEELDPDGITIYVSCRSGEVNCLFQKYERVTSATLVPVIEKHLPPEQVNLKEVLQVALDDYFTRKSAGYTKENGEIVIVLIDGEPNDRMAVAKAIKNATQKMDTGEELGIGFVQIGEDMMAQGFLTALDNHLRAAGAKFDVVTTKTLHHIESDSLTQFLLETLFD